MKPDLDIGQFVGRELEVELLLDRFDAAKQGHGSIVLVAGDAGIGKTWTVGEFTRLATEHGGRAYLGSCWESCWEGEGGEPYSPWLEVLRAYCASVDVRSIVGRLGEAAQHLARLIPEISAHLSPQSLRSAEAKEATEYHLYEAVSVLLSQAARREPLLIVLEDLHWADSASLNLLQYLIRSTRASRLLILGTYRDSGLLPRHPLRHIASELRRTRVGETLVLEGLSAEETLRLVAATSGGELGVSGVELAQRLYEETEGNPFFIREVLRHLVETHRIRRDGTRWVVTATRDELPIPDEVQDIIRRRLDLLGNHCREVLRLAAVLGRSFNIRTLEQTSELDRNALLALLEEAEASRVIIPTPGTADSFHFAHALIRSTLYASLPKVTRLSLHHDVARALETFYESETDLHLAELAHHFCRAASTAIEDDEWIEKACDYATRAGDRAMDVYAYDDASRLYRMAISTAELKVPKDDERICELSLSLGIALWRLGNRSESEESLVRAADLALEHNLLVPLSRAVAHLTSAWEECTKFNAHFERLSAAVEAWQRDGTEHPLRVRVMGRFALAMYWRNDPRASSMITDAMAMATRINDDARAARAYGLNAMHFVTWGPDSVSARLAAARELLEIGEHTRDLMRILQARRYLLLDEIELGEVEELELETSLSLFVQQCKDLGHKVLIWLSLSFETFWAMMRGELGSSEAYAKQAYSSGQAVLNDAAPQWLTVQLFLLRVEQDRLPELLDQFSIDHLRRLTEVDNPTSKVWRVIMANISLKTGEVIESREGYEYFAVDHFSLVPRDAHWLFAMAMLTEVNVALHDTRRAEILYELLIPYENQNILFGTAAACLGSVSRYLGMLAVELSKWDEAERHFSNSMARNTAIGARLWVAHTEYELASMLMLRDRPGDRDDAKRILDSAVAHARQLGLTRLNERALMLDATEDTLSMLAPLNEIALSRYRVVGSYYRYSASVREELNEIYQRVSHAVLNRSRTQENYLLWAPPGSGKSFLIQEIQRSLGSAVRYVELNLAKCSETDFRFQLDGLDEDAPALCFIDECDARPTESWPYEALLSQMEARERRGATFVFVLAGSGGMDIHGLEDLLRDRHRGSDVLSRIPHGNRYGIGRIDSRDRIILALSQIDRAGKGKEAGRNISGVEKLALYFIAVHLRDSSARELSDVATRAVRRTSAEESRLRYDNLFDAGDETRYSFRDQHKSEVGNLADTFVVIE